MKAAPAANLLADRPPPVAVSPQRFAVGQVVAVIRLGASTEPYLEGFATVQGRLSRHRYNVRFLGEAVTRERPVLPAFQHNPRELIAALRALWNAEPGMRAVISDFFPGD